MGSGLTRRWRWSALALLLLAVGGAALALHSAVALARFERAQARRATFIYAAPQRFAPGVHVGLV